MVVVVLVMVMVVEVVRLNIWANTLPLPSEPMQKFAFVYVFISFLIMTSLYQPPPRSPPKVCLAPFLTFYLKWLLLQTSVAFLQRNTDNYNMKAPLSL